MNSSGFTGKFGSGSMATSNSQNSQSSTLSFVSFVSFVQFRSANVGGSTTGESQDTSPVVLEVDGTVEWVAFVGECLWVSLGFWERAPDSRQMRSRWTFWVRCAPA